MGVDETGPNESRDIHIMKHSKIQVFLMVFQDFNVGVSSHH